MNIEVFCLKDNDKRPYLLRPFTQGSFTYGTDGYIIIRVPAIAGYEINSEDKNHFPDVINTKLKWDHDSGIHVWEDPPKVKKSELKPCYTCDGDGNAIICNECDGDGMVEYDSGYNTYEWECKSCDGAGYKPGGKNKCPECQGIGKDLKASATKFGNRHFSSYYINTLNNEFNRVKFSKADDDDQYGQLRFLFEGGCGILMPMRY